MRQVIRSRRTWARFTFAVVLTVAVLAGPATAKGPVFNQPMCPPTAQDRAMPSGPQLRPPCVPRDVTDGGHGANGGAAAIVAGGAAALVLVLAGGLHLATHRREAPARPRLS